MVSREELDAMFSALSHSARRAVVKALGERGELTFVEMVRVSGVGEAGAFGFHLKRLSPLLEKSSTGRYRLSRLGRLAYSLLGLAEGKPVLVGEPKVLSGMEECLLDGRTLEEVGPLEVENCGRVVIASDVTPQLLDEKLLSVRSVEELVVPRHLYPSTLRRVEKDVSRVEVYEGARTPPCSTTKLVENYGNLVIDCGKLAQPVEVKNYGVLRLEGLTDQSIAKIKYVENYGTIEVPKGLRERILPLVRNYGLVREYEETGELSSSASRG